jgi:dihydrofolate reductase
MHIVDRWGGSHPIHGVPVFVLSHHIPEEVPKGATPFTFVTDGIESAITQAKAAAGEKYVYVLGGANIAQQCVRAGLLDEILIHFVPVLLGEGIRLFEHIGTEQIELESTRVAESPGVTHLWFRSNDRYSVNRKEIKH